MSAGRINRTNSDYQMAAQLTTYRLAMEQARSLIRLGRYAMAWAVLDDALHDPTREPKGPSCV